jgi:hypothetical protein
MAGSVITAGTTRTQAGATQITEDIVTVNTSTAATAGTNFGDGVALPQVGSGTDKVFLINNTANPIQVYAFNGSSDTINGIAGSNGIAIPPGGSATFIEANPGAWSCLLDSPQSVAFNTNTATAGATLTAANVTGGEDLVDLAMTGTLGAGANAQLPTVANLLQSMYAPAVGSSYRLRIINRSSANFAWTVTTNTGWTLTGTMSVAQNTWRDFVVTITSLTTATLQAVGVGTDS